MPSLGHVAVGMAAGRAHAPRTRSAAAAMVVFTCLSCLPDLDAIGFSLGVPYGAPFGHRGALHSLTFALGAGALAALLLGGVGRSRLRLGLSAFAVVASHDLLDAMTRGGLGAALLWPFTNRRFFLPWRPIPVAPIGARFFSARGLSVFWAELLLFSLFLIYALWPRPRRALGTEALDG